MVLIIIHTRGWIPYDEGLFLAAAARMDAGQKIYADFQFIYNPGGVFLNFLAFRLFGVSILATRILALANCLVGVWLVLRIVKKYNLTILGETLAVGIYVFWGPGQINFSWPVMWCLSGGLLWVLMFLEKRYFWAGIAAGLTFIFKQNFGLGIAIASGIGLVLIETGERRISWVKFVGGYGLTISLLVAYFVSQGTLIIYLKQIWYFTVVRILVGGALKSPWPWEYPTPIYILMVKLAGYAWPAGIAVWAWIKSRTLSGKIVPLLVLAFWAVSIRPTTDFVHLAPLIALTGLTGVVATKEMSGKSKYLLMLGLAGILIWGAGQAVWGRYYKWNTPLISQNIWNNNPRVRIFTDKTANQSIILLTDYFAKNLNKENKLFVYSFSPIWYVILGKENPTQYDYVHSGVILAEDEEKIISDLINQKVRVIMTDHKMEDSGKMIVKYIKQFYQPTLRVNEYTIWEKPLDSSRI